MLWYSLKRTVLSRQPSNTAELICVEGFKSLRQETFGGACAAKGGLTAKFKNSLILGMITLKDYSSTKLKTFMSFGCSFTRQQSFGGLKM